MAQVPYDATTERFNHPQTGKTPWLEWRGEELADSTLIVQRIIADTGTDPDESLTEHERAVSRAFQKMLEENTYWPAALYRFVYTNDGREMVRTMGFGAIAAYFVTMMITRSIRNEAHGHGIGRLSQEQVTDSFMRDSQAVTDYLGDKPFLLGDEPHLVDCTAFGVFCEVLYGTPPGMVLAEALRTNMPTLVQYVDRMKERFYPDWDELLKKSA